MSGMQVVKSLTIIFSKPHQVGNKPDGEEITEVTFENTYFRKEVYGIEVQPQGELVSYIYPWHKIDRVKQTR